MSYPATRLNVTPGVVFRGLAAAASLKGAVLQWRQRRRGRKELAKLSERDRRDLAYSSCDVDAETAKPFWIP